MSSPAAGFGGVFWARLSVDDRAKRVADKSMEFLWRPSASTGDASLSFGHAFRIHYSAPDGFSFDSHEVGAQQFGTNNIELWLGGVLTLSACLLTVCSA